MFGDNGIGHLTRDGKVACLLELARVLKPGGVALLSLRTPYALNRMLPRLLRNVVLPRKGLRPDEERDDDQYVQRPPLAWLVRACREARLEPVCVCSYRQAAAGRFPRARRRSAASSSSSPPRSGGLPPAELVEHHHEGAAARVLLARGARERDDLVAAAVRLGGLAHRAQMPDRARVALALRRLELGRDEQAVVHQRRVEVVDGGDARELDAARARARAGASRLRARRR